MLGWVRYAIARPPVTFLLENLYNIIPVRYRDRYHTREADAHAGDVRAGASSQLSHSGSARGK